jgi:hypothetical protein
MIAIGVRNAGVFIVCAHSMLVLIFLPTATVAFTRRRSSQVPPLFLAVRFRSHEVVKHSAIRRNFLPPHFA